MQWLLCLPVNTSNQVTPVYAVPPMSLVNPTHVSGDLSKLSVLSECHHAVHVASITQVDAVVPVCFLVNPVFSVTPVSSD